MASNKNPYIPELVTITNIIEETPNCRSKARKHEPGIIAYSRRLRRAR